MKRKIRVAIVDDHKLVRKSMSGLLNGEAIHVVGEYIDGRDFLDHAKFDDIDVVLMDYNMPVMNGVECCSHLTAANADVRVLALSMNEDEMSISAMIRAGARGYVTKNSEIDDLLMAIENVVSQGFHFSDLVSPIFALKVGENEATPTSDRTNLTPRERDFLEYCCSEMTYKEIAEKMIVSVRTVDGYREGLFEKLGIKNRVGLVLYAIKMGIYKVNG